MEKTICVWIIEFVTVGSLIYVRMSQLKVVGRRFPT